MLCLTRGQAPGQAMSNSSDRIPPFIGANDPLIRCLDELTAYIYLRRLRLFIGRRCNGVGVHLRLVTLAGETSSWKTRLQLLS